MQLDIEAYGGKVRLGEAATVGGDVNVYGSSFKRAEGARVAGQVITGEAPFDFTVVFSLPKAAARG